MKIRIKGNNSCGTTKILKSQLPTVEVGIYLRSLAKSENEKKQKSPLYDTA